MKIVIFSFFFGFVCQAKASFSEQTMYRKTSEAIAKFYGLDELGNEISRRIQEKYLKEEYKPYIPYITSVSGILINKKITFRKEF